MTLYSRYVAPVSLLQRPAKSLAQVPASSFDFHEVDFGCASFLRRAVPDGSCGRDERSLEGALRSCGSLAVSFGPTATEQPRLRGTRTCALPCRMSAQLQVLGR